MQDTRRTAKSPGRVPSCGEAGLLCIKEAIARGEDHDRVVVRMDHLESAIEQERSSRRMFQLTEISAGLRR